MKGRENRIESETRIYDTRNRMGSETRILYRRNRMAARAAALALAGCLASWGAAAWAMGTDGTEDGLFIEEGDVTTRSEGESLEEVQRQEELRRQESERLQELARMAEEEFLEDQDLILEPASEDNLSRYLENLTNQESPTGSDGELICADYIGAVMEEYGYTVSMQDFHEGFLNENGVDAPGINVIAERGADSENRTNDIFVLSTHYDSKTNPEEGDPFANDKTGVAVLLETARILSGVDTDTDICFVFYSGEEDGRFGSGHFARFLEEEGQTGRVTGALHVELAGYAMDAPYLLKTVDGMSNYAADLAWEAVSLVRMRRTGVTAAGAASPDALENPEGTGADAASAMREGDTWDQENWIYAQDGAGSHAGLAALGIPAVTIAQDVWHTVREADAQLTEEGDALAWPEEEGTEQTRLMEGDSSETTLSDGGTAELPESDQNTEAKNAAPEVDLRRLQDMTDILAAAAARVMGER